MELPKLTTWICIPLIALGLALGNVTLNAQETEEPQVERPNPAIRELLGERAEYREALQDLDSERDVVRKELDTISALLELQYQLQKLELFLESSDSRGDRTDRLADQIDATERKIELLHHSRELNQFRNHIRELRKFLEELQPENVEPIEEHLRKLDRACAQLQEHVEQQRRKPFNLRGAERDYFEELAIQLDQGHEFFELLEHYLVAVDEDREMEAKELELELAGYLELEDSPSRHEPSVRRDTESPRPELLPVPIDELGLAQFRDLDFVSQVVPLLRESCFDCHSNSSSYGDLNIEKLISQRPLVANRDAWINVIAQVKNRVMPPDDAALLSEAQRRKMVLALHSKIHEFDYSQIKNPGFEATRRLTHVEYDNSLSDLFGVKIEAAAKFPKELTGRSGFANSGNTLFLQPTLMERYMHAADTVIEELLPEVPTNDRQRQAKSRVFLSPPKSPDAESTSARKIITRFATRAFRRPLEESELSRLLSRYHELRESGLGFQAAIRATVQRVLISPYFLLKFETTPEVNDQGASKATSAAFRVNDWELASRLSYFLWSSMPDDALLRLAQQGRLHEPQILEAQVQRMLADPRSGELGRNFAAQWLGSEHIGSRVRLDPIDNPWCTDSLMEAMKDETAMFVHSLIVDDQPIERLIDAGYTFLNRELAKHYKIRGISGDQMRRVDLEGHPRGGILGHASLLAVTSFPYRTSPVVRGKWILETVLGTPPPPPPPNVSELSEEILHNERLTIRQKLERHRRSPSCAACHSEMDPLGLSLEKYDWFGRYRERYERGRIDDRGSLPTGEEFEGLTGLKQVILDSRRSDLVRQVTQRMLAYALGRQLEYYDEPAVQRIIAKVEQNDRKFQTLVQQIVMSFPFQYKQPQPADQVVASQGE